MKRGILIALLLSFGPAVSNSFARFAYALLLPSMRSELAMSYAQAGWLNTANAIGYLIGALVTRALVNRVGNRVLFIAGMWLTAIAVGATGLASDIGLLSFWRLLAGACGAAVFICGGALSGNIFPDKPALGTTTIAVYFAGGGIGLALCGAAIPLLLQAQGPSSWPMAWQAMAIVALLMSLATQWAANRIEEPSLVSASGATDAIAHATGAAIATGAANATVAATVATTVSTPIAPLLPELLAYVCFGLGYIGYMTFVVAWMNANGAGLWSVIATWVVLGLATIAAPVVWRAPLAQWSGGRPMTLIMIVLASGAVLPLVSTNFGMMILSASLFGLGMFSVPSAVSSLIKRQLPKPAWGSMMASFTIAFAAGQIVGPVLAGWLADWQGSLAPGLAVSAAVLLLGAAIGSRQRDLDG